MGRTVSAVERLSQLWRLRQGGGFAHVRVLGCAGAIVFLVSAAVVWAGPVLHEHFRSDPEEDLRLGATNSSGHLPSAIQTKSGWVSAPDPIEPRRSNQDSEPAYGAKQTNLGSAFVLDNLTVKPRRVDYDEPFRPSILPYKRLFAFDAIDHNFSLIVSDRSLSELVVGGQVLATDDVFFGDFEVDLVKEVAVRIPSVGPDAHVLALQVDPPRTVSLLHDGADNWFVRAKEGGRVRIVMQVSIDRQTFGSQFLPVGRAALRPYLPQLPEPVVSGASEVLAHIGAHAELSPAGALRILVDYFRSFHESDELPQATKPRALYQEISLSQKGVCRHRAFAFVVTALVWGLPARLVHNEAHAWVEVFDTELWHRIDLGGAASDLRSTGPDPLLVQHRPPLDPFSWPTSERPAAVEFERVLTQMSSPSRLPSRGEAGRAEPSRDPQASSVQGDRSQQSSEPRSVVLPASDPHNLVTIELQVEGEQHLRGRPFTVSGRAVSSTGEPCALSRIDIQVTIGDKWTVIGSVATARDGSFKGPITLPSSLPVGGSAVQAILGAGCRPPI